LPFKQPHLVTRLKQIHFLLWIQMFTPFVFAPLEAKGNADKGVHFLPFENAEIMSKASLQTKNP
jgi:hypothetical protein